MLWLSIDSDESLPSPKHSAAFKETATLTSPDVEASPVPATPSTAQTPPTFEQPSTSSIIDASICSFICHVGLLNIFSILICLATYQLAAYSEDIYNDATMLTISWVCFAGICLNIVSLAWVVHIYFLRFQITMWFYFRQTVAGVSYLYDLLVLRSVGYVMERASAFYDTMKVQTLGFLSKITGISITTKSAEVKNENAVEDTLRTAQDSIREEHDRNLARLEKDWRAGKWVAIVILLGSIALLVMANVKRQQQK